MDSQAVSQIEDVIKERETNADDLGMTSPQKDLEMPDVPATTTTTKNGKRGSVVHRLDKKQVEQRIEEDRERHKRERESIWAIPKTNGAEMDKLWEETSDLGEDDDRMIAEETNTFATEMEMLKCHHQTTANGNHS